MPLGPPRGAPGRRRIGLAGAASAQRLEGDPLRSYGDAAGEGLSVRTRLAPVFHRELGATSFSPRFRPWYSGSAAIFLAGNWDELLHSPGIRHWQCADSRWGATSLAGRAQLTETCTRQVASLDFAPLIVWSQAWPLGANRCKNEEGSHGHPQRFRAPAADAFAR